MENKLPFTPSKETLVFLFEDWLKSRPGLDWRDYGGGRDGYAAYRAESRRITQQKNDGLRILAWLERSAITAEEIIEGFRAFSGRLELCHDDKRGFYFSYCTGQYYPTEYRAAACAVMASALWAYYRDENSTGDSMRATFRRIFGNSLARRWFN